MSDPLGASPCLELAVAGRPLAGEPVSGDLEVHVAGARGAVLAVVDGLGHGVEAADAARRAREVVEARADDPLADVLAAAHAALARTRGVAMTIASLSCAGDMQWVGVGNVEAHLLRAEGDGVRRAASAVLYGGVVGYRLPSVRVSSVVLEPGDLVVMATDGITTDFTEHVSPSEPVDRIVATVVERCARPSDDALVAAARFTGPTA